MALSMHPMQKAISKEELFKAAERAVVSAVTQVGSLSLFTLSAFLLSSLASIVGYAYQHAQDMLM